MNDFLTYRVGELSFAIDIKNDTLSEKELAHYAPFRTVSSEVSEYLFILKIISPDNFPYSSGEEIVSFEDANGRMTLYSLPQNRMAFHFLSPAKTECCKIWIENDYRKAIACIEGNSAERRFAFDSVLMLLYALASSQYHTLLLHASVIDYKGKGYLFLGKSGTGKSTHSRLWLENIPGTKLLNDDNPIVRIMDGNVYVFGSPWSGKTPCYKNRKIEAGAFIKLSQAPYNAINPLSAIKGYAALLPSCSGLKWNHSMAQNLHNTLGIIIEKIPVFAMECLPDKDAAVMCMKEVTERGIYPENKN